jgi:hypothetical protein
MGFVRALRPGASGEALFMLPVAGARRDRVAVAKERVAAGDWPSEVESGC